MRTNWYYLALLLFVPALMGFRACGSDVDIGGSNPGAAEADASAGYDPCGGLSCGEQCSQCPPHVRDCFEPAVINYCQADGSCSPSRPTCDPQPYDPCEGLSCGASCSLCPPDDPTCVEPAVLNYCQTDGTCRPTTPECASCDQSEVTCRAPTPVCRDGQVPSVVDNCWGPCVPVEWCPPYDPCEGLRCGASCSQCPPYDPSCVEPAVLNYCHRDGTCSPSRPDCVNCDQSEVHCRALPPVCRDGEVPSVEGNCWGPCVPVEWCPPAYDPCEGLSCGEHCSQCPPDDRDCVEPAVINYCQRDGSCAPSPPECVSCQRTEVFCRATPPECAPGEVPSVIGSCWGPCVPAEWCAPYDPCAERSCGASCNHCPPGDLDCVEPAVLNYCQPDGSCRSTPPDCRDTCEGRDYCDCTGECEPIVEGCLCEFVDPFNCTGEPGACICHDPSAYRGCRARAGGVDR